MSNLLMLSAAASVIAIGMSVYHAEALSPGANSASPDGTVLKIQKSDEKGPGTRDGGAKAGNSGARGQDGGKGAGTGATQEKRSDPGVAQDKGDRGGQVRSGGKGARGDGAKGQQRSNVDVDVRAGAATETGRPGAPGWISMSIAGADPAEGMSMSAWGGMGIAAV